MDSPGVGLGATIAFGTSSVTLKIRKIDDDVPGHDAKDVTYLGSTEPSGSGKFGGREYIKTKLGDPGTLKLEVFVDAYGQLDALKGVSETITLTFPLGDGETVATKVEGTGFILGDLSYSITEDEVTVATMSIKKTGVWTATDAT